MNQATSKCSHDKIVGCRFAYDLGSTLYLIVSFKALAESVDRDMVGQLLSRRLLGCHFCAAQATDRSLRDGPPVLAPARPQTSC